MNSHSQQSSFTPTPRSARRSSRLRLMLAGGALAFLGGGGVALATGQTTTHDPGTAASPLAQRPQEEAGNGAADVKTLAIAGYGLRY